jgi:predicted metal-dependent hydrolase
MTRPEAGTAGTAVSIAWRRHPRARRISLRLEPRTATVIITLPPKASEASGLAWLHQNAAWVERGLSTLADSPRLADGETVPLEGAPLVIRAVPDARRGVWREDGILNVSGDVAFLPRRVMDFLRAEARPRLGARLRARAGDMGLTPARLDLRDTRSRWGSCTRDGRIMLSWRLVMAPVDVQDYVIVHELAHLRHFDHSAAFWTLVDRYAPRRHAAERWLKREGATLLRIA